MTADLRTADCAHGEDGMVNSREATPALTSAAGMIVPLVASDLPLI